MTRIRRFTAPLPALILLAACAATAGPEDLDRRMSAYVGRPEADLVAGLGVPSRTYEAQGRRLLAYEFGGTATSPAIVPGLGLGLGFGSGGFGGGGPGIGTGLGFGLGGYGGAPVATCSVTFELREDRVLGFDRRGDGCADVSAT